MNRRRHTFSHSALAGIFALTLALTVICGSYTPVRSQQPSPSPRAALEERIQADVERRLDAGGELLSDAEIEKRYFEEAQAAGLTYGELMRLYEEVYIAQQKARKTSPLERWIQNIPLFAVLLLLILSIFRDALHDVFRDVLKGPIKDCLYLIYRPFAGMWLFRLVTLPNYRAKLVENYQDLPMPFIKNRDSLKMSKVYVPLKVSEVRQGEQPDLDGTGPKHESTDALKAIADHRRLMVIGEPGSGKSVLLKYLAWAYGLGQLDTLPDRPKVVLLELYRLSDASLNEAKLVQALVDAFDRNKFPNAQNFVRQGLASGTLMLLLDGLDEVNSDVRPHVVRVIRDLLKKHSHCRVVITCRTQVYDDEFSDIVERKLEVVEFTDQQMRRFLRAWELEMQQARKSINQMMAALRERPLILKLARNPLLLTLIAYLYTEPGFVLPRSRAEFYDKSTGILLEQREYKGDDDYKHYLYTEPNEKRRVLQYLALYTQDHSAELQDRRSLKAEVVREQVKQVLPSLDIPEKEAKDILDEIAERSGLFMKIDGGERYLFPHLTIQEYFAAAALKDEDAKLISRFEADPTAWREVVKLGCSLAKNSTDLVAAIYQQDPITGLECLAEASEVDPTLANQIIHHFQLRLDQPQTDDTLARAFGAIAANDRLRGQEVFAFLKDTLLDPQVSDLRRAFAAEALSRTNLPKAASVLIGWYQNSQPIVRMGDLAVPGLTELAQKGILQALNDLYAIATPDAANALASLLWSDQVSVAGRAAWYLGSLLPQLDIEASLREFKFPPHDRQNPWRDLLVANINAIVDPSRQAESLDWIWRPFKEPNKSALPIITERIAYLLEYNSWPSDSGPPPALDPRLVVPLCTLHLKPSALPKSLPNTVEALLEQTEQTPQLDQACREARDQVLASQPDADQPWGTLIATLPPRVGLDLLSRLISQHQPERRHWDGLFDVVNYDLRTSWQYKVTLLIAAGLSIVALVAAGVRAYVNYENPWLEGTFSFSTVIVLVFWLALRHGIETPWEPTLFADLGLRGVFAFIQCSLQAMRKQIIWSGFETIYEGLTGYTFALFFAGVFAVFFVVASHAAWAVVFAGVVPGTFPGTFVALTLLLALTTPLMSATRFPVGSALLAVCVVALALLLYFDSAFSFLGLSHISFFGHLVVPQNQDLMSVLAIYTSAVAVVTGTGMGAWHQLKSTPDKKWLRVLAWFAFPWFCWLPIVSVLSTWALYDFLSRVSPVTIIPLWQQTALGVAIVAAIWAVPWQWGLRQEARARNPFHGGALGAALGVKRLELKKSSSA